MAGILYLCATPIGNLEDMTPRAQRMLAEADIIAAEDTRHTLQLLNRFNIKGRLVRYDEHSKERQGAYLLDELLSGKNIALVSDAGFPGIADPGEQLARLAIDAGVQVVPVPGANAALCALIASGLPASPFFSADFCPKAKKTGGSSWKNGSICRLRLFCTKRRTGSNRCCRKCWRSGGTDSWRQRVS